MLLVDTNVLIDVLEDDPRWADWSIRQLRAQSQVHALTINSVIYTELSSAFTSLESLDTVVKQLQLGWLELSRPVLFLAGKAFAGYRRLGGKRERILGDFYVGAHAQVAGLTLLTRDTTRYRTYFPKVKLIAPA